MRYAICDRLSRATSARCERKRHSTRFLLSAVIVGALLHSSSDPQAEDHPGKVIYVKHCVSCHGDTGQGTPDNYPEPLAGDRPLVELSRVIAETMPEEDSTVVVGKDAALVAAYIYDAFYSPIAQARIRPARVDLQRLTVRQYRNAVADLVGLFRGGRKLDDRRGLKAEYFASGRFSRDKNTDFNRVDSMVDFDFGTELPEGTKFTKKEEFSIRWQGSVIAPETGDYEFIIRTDNGMQFWLNDSKVPFIDGKVSSGKDAEHRRSMFLVAGRIYPLRLDFFKFKDPTAQIRLHWKAPFKTEETIPERCLVPDRFQEVLTVETPFPPDDRSTGYVRGTAVSREWDAATTSAAIEVGRKVFDDLDRLSGSRSKDDKREEKLRAFSQRFVERAFRRPLSDEQKKIYIDDQFEKADDPDSAVQRVVMLALKSPRFLYREIGGQNDSFDVASRLSFGLWDSLPDTQLWNGANGKSLERRDQVSRTAIRMVSDPRTQAKLRAFFHQWLKLDHIHDVSKDSDQFAGFDKELFADLRTSLELTVDDIISREKPDFRDLLLAKETYFNGRLAKFYGAELPAESDFQKVVFEPDVRAGVISHPFLMSGFASLTSSSPIHRGVFLTRNVLGRVLKTPAVAIAPSPPEAAPDLTTRERILLQTSTVTCRSCHELINPLGFALEHFDAAGRFRKQDQNKDVDASGFYVQQTGERAVFNGAGELGAFLAGSEEVHDAFVEQLFQHVTKQPIQAYGSGAATELRELFVSSGFNIKTLLAGIATVAAFDHPE